VQKALMVLAHLMNYLHDVIIAVTGRLGFHMSDKDLHFWLVGGLGLVLFIIADKVFKWAAKWNISVVSFIYTFTVLVVLVFALEIEQGITGRGNMEFKDIVAGLWGFIAIFSVFLLIRIIVFGFTRLLGRKIR
jgi:type IV secretory pathway TrbD component